MERFNLFCSTYLSRHYSLLIACGYSAKCIPNSEDKKYLDITLNLLHGGHVRTSCKHIICLHYQGISLLCGKLKFVMVITKTVQSLSYSIPEQLLSSSFFWFASKRFTFSLKRFLKSLCISLYTYNNLGACQLILSKFLIQKFREYYLAILFSFKIGQP